MVFTFSKKIFEAGFKVALEEELMRKGVSIKELAENAGIPPATIYKITSGERDPRFSTVQAIVNALEPPAGSVHYGTLRFFLVRTMRS